MAKLFFMAIGVIVCLFLLLMTLLLIRLLISTIIHKNGEMGFNKWWGIFTMTILLGVVFGIWSNVLHLFFNINLPLPKVASFFRSLLTEPLR